MEKELPEEFVEEMTELLGKEDALLLCGSLKHSESPVSIRVNPRKKGDRSLYEGMSPVPWNRYGYYIPERPPFTLNPLLHAGVFYVQEAASMILGWIVSRLPFSGPINAVDLCAAPGGKSGAAIDALTDGSVMLANEFVGSRAQILRENLVKQGYPDVIVTNSDVAAIGRLGSTFDLMIADVPCSGEGMMRKEEVARTQWSPGLVNRCQALQREILNEGLKALKPGGYLIYSTCTFNRKENEDNVRWLIDEFGLENIPLDIPEEWGISPALDPNLNALRFYPHKTAAEGLFVALLRKPEDAKETIPDYNNSGNKNKFRRKGTDKSPSADLSSMGKWLKEGRYELCANSKGDIRAMTRQTAELQRKVEAAGIRIISAGIEVASVKGRDYVPTSYLALSTALDEDAFASVELSEGEALDYLRHEAIRLPEDTPKGFVLMKFEGHPIGFVKNIGNRANNLYPSEWRIRNK